MNLQLKKVKVKRAELQRHGGSLPKEPVSARGKRRVEKKK